MNTMLKNSQNSTSLKEQFFKFCSDFKKSGQDPNALLNQMIASGRVTKEQVDNAIKMSRIFAGLLK